MSNLLNKIRGTDETSSPNTFSGRNTDELDNAGSSGMNYTGTDSTATGSSIGRDTGITGSTGSVGTTTASTGTTGVGQGHAHIHGSDQYASTTFQHNAQVHFSGHQTDATVSTQNQATNVQVPGQHITATLPAKQVIVEVPERQVEVDLPARNIQLENNPEIEVTTKPNIRSVAASAVAEGEAALGMGTRSGASSHTGVSSGTSAGDRIDPKTASNY